MECSDIPAPKIECFSTEQTRLNFLKSILYKMPQNNKTQKKITKLNKALGLARMRLRAIERVDPDAISRLAHRKGEMHGRGKGYELGLTLGREYQAAEFKDLPFWAKVKFLFSK